MIKWDEYLLYKKLKHMSEGNNISCEMLGKTQNNSGKIETLNHPILLHKQQGLQGYLRLQRMGLSTADIAKRVGKTANHINQYLNLATANVDVQQMVERGENAGKVLEQAKEKAAKQGKTKVTASVVKEWLPPRKNLVSLVSGAKQLEKGIVFSTDGSKATVTVDAEVGIHERCFITND